MPLNSLEDCCRCTLKLKLLPLTAAASLSSAAASLSQPHHCPSAVFFCCYLCCLLLLPLLFSAAASLSQPHHCPSWLLSLRLPEASVIVRCWNLLLKTVGGVFAAKITIVTEVVWEGDAAERSKVDTIATDNNSENRLPPVDKSAASHVPSNPVSKIGSTKAKTAKDTKQANILSFFKKV